MNAVPEVHKWRNLMGVRGSVKVLALTTIAAVIVVVVFVLPIKVPYTVTTFGRLQPVQKWTLTTGPDGQLLTSLIDYRTGVSSGYRASQFAREGTMTFRFHPRVMDGQSIRAGDTVGTIYSSETEERVADLEGQLAAMRAALTAESTGEKEAVVRQYEVVLAHAEEKATNQRRIVDRLRVLNERKLIMPEEFEIAESEGRLLDLEIDIARAQLESARTGVKAASAALTEANIAALTEDLKTVRRRLESFSLLAPVSGRISRTYSSDTLLVVSDTSAYVALIPITVSDVPYVAPDLPVRITVGRKDDQVNGRLLLLDTETHQLKGRQIQIGTALVEGAPTALPLGMISPCVVECGSVSLREYVKRVIEGM
jgi:hypothetical protein